MNLETARLKLRPWRSDDFAKLFALNSEPEVSAWLAGPSLADRSADALALMQNRYQEYGWGVLLVEDLRGCFLGLAGLQPVQSHVPIPPSTEIVWRFRSAAWGKGYASEAATAILENASRYGAPGDVVAIVAAPNTRSARTAVKVGMHRFPILDFLHPALQDDHPLKPHHVFVLPPHGHRPHAPVA
jgi:RimJ/RimL family protein N-acetyltransferase